MGGYRLIDHTADLGVEATGEDFADALAYIATGMFSIVADLDAVVARDSIHVEVESRSRESLVVDWLNELLYRFEGEGFVPKGFEVVVDEAGTALQARCVGEAADRERHRLSPSVKAATYHGLQVSRNGEWRIRVVLDM